MNMVNYIKSELYKLFSSLHAKIILIFCIGFGLALGLIGFSYKEYILDIFMLYKSLLSYSFFVTLIAAEIVFRDEYRYNTMKNVLSFGIERKTIFIGKLLISILVQVIMIVLILASLIGMICILYYGDLGNIKVEIKDLLTVLVKVTPFWLAGLGITTSLNFICEDKLEALAAFFTIVFIPSIMAALVTMFDIGSIETVSKYLIIPNLIKIKQSNGIGLLNCVTIGCSYFLCFTIIGFGLFRKKEVK